MTIARDATSLACQKARDITDISDTKPQPILNSIPAKNKGPITHPRQQEHEVASLVAQLAEMARLRPQPLHECNEVLTPITYDDLIFGHGRAGGLKVADTTCFEPQMTGEG